MRASFVFSEVVTGLRRNVTMTIAMVITTAISLGLLGGGLLIVRVIDKMQTIYHDAVGVSVYLDGPTSTNDANCTQQVCAGLLSQLKAAPGVTSVQFESRDQAFARFQQMFEGQPELVALARRESLPASFRVKLADPQLFSALSKAFTGKPGVDRLTDQSVFLQRLFSLLAGVRNAVFAVALVQALAAVLLISNTIQVSAFTRRTEVGIMRLVGATRWYTQLPFLLEAVVAGLAGAVLAVAGLVVAKLTFLDSVLQSPQQAGIIPKLSLVGDVLIWTSPVLVAIAVGISAITGYITLRAYVRL
jgi:cell division transport system permease protein